MKRYLLIVGLIMLALSYLTLSGCATNRNPYINTDLTSETWMRGVSTSPNGWTRGADSWFLTGDANAIEMGNRSASYSDAISTMMVRVSEFNNVKVGGDFQVQIFGTDGPETVYLYGPNGGVRDISVAVQGTTLCISQIKGASPAVRKVIVRIGIHNLNHLTHMGGCATIEAVHLRSNELFISTAPNSVGNMYLSGYMDVRRIEHRGTSAINIFGAQSSALDMETSGGGAVNMIGNVSLRTIRHVGSATINVIGVNTRCPVKIYTEGRGKIGLNGHLNLAEVIAKGYTCVYAYGVNSNYLYAYAYDRARIGLAGYARELYVDTNNYARFEGRYLCATNAYVKAHDDSHINVAAASKIFASSTQSSSVYFFGSPELMSQFVSGSGLVIPVWMRGYPSCYIAPPRPHVPVDYKGERARHRAQRM